jgi:cytochrome oxidase Cu insertion factor (SCO1/SenC/PrrC family)
VNLATMEGFMRKRLMLIVGLVLTLGWAGSAAALAVGDKAPDFALNGTDGKPVKLSDLTAKGPIVVYTFIAAFTGT